MFKYVAVAKILKKHKPSVDNSIFKLHYRTTFLILVIASSFISAKEFFGSPINCYSVGTVPKDVLNSYCFIMSTFSVPRHFAKPLGDGVAFQGLGHHEADEEVVYHAYYQWVPLFLFFQAILFYTPRFIWKSTEGGLFDVVLGGMDQPEMEETKLRKKHRILSAYMVKNHHQHMLWAWRFFMCEFLALAIVVGNIFFTDYFLGGTFLKYGTEIMSFINDVDSADRVDPMIRIFPTVSKCNFRAHGPSGTIEVHDSMCLLAVNILNQKIFVLLWFWFIILAVLTALWTIFRIATIVSSSVRFWTLRHRGRAAGEDSLNRIQKHCDLGDWFLLDQLGRAIEPTTYGQFLKELSDEIAVMPEEEEKPMMFRS